MTSRTGRSSTSSGSAGARRGPSSRSLRTWCSANSKIFSRRCARAMPTQPPPPPPPAPHRLLVARLVGSRVCELCLYEVPNNFLVIEGSKLRRSPLSVCPRSRARDLAQLSSIGPGRPTDRDALAQAARKAAAQRALQLLIHEHLCLCLSRLLFSGSERCNDHSATIAARTATLKDICERRCCHRRRVGEGVHGHEGKRDQS